MKRILLAAAVGLAGISSAHAGAPTFRKGNELYWFCTAETKVKSEQDDVRIARFLCGAYIEGAIDGNNKSLCLRNGVNSSQLVDVVVNYLRAHPESRDFNAASVVGVAVREAFCK